MQHDTGSRRRRRVTTITAVRVLGAGAAGLLAAWVVGQYRFDGRLPERANRSEPPTAKTASGRPRPVDIPSVQIAVAGGATRGDPASPLALVNYSDFDCPFCRKFATATLPELDRAFVSNGRLLIVFKHLPIGSLHPRAREKARLAVCANRHGKFWDVHDALFALKTGGSVEDMSSLAKSVGLGGNSLLQCMAEPSSLEAVEGDLSDARSFGIAGTPTFFVGRLDHGVVSASKLISGAQPTAVFISLIEELLQAAR